MRKNNKTLLTKKQVKQIAKKEAMKIVAKSNISFKMDKEFLMTCPLYPARSKEDYRNFLVPELMKPTLQCYETNFKDITNENHD